MSRYFTSANPLARLRAWALAEPGRTLVVTAGANGGHVEACDLEPCPARNCKVAHVWHGYGRTTDLAADQCLARIASHHQQEPTP